MPEIYSPIDDDEQQQQDPVADMPDDEEQQGSATGAPQFTQASVAQQQEYVPWSSFESANRDVSQREARELREKVQGDVNKAKAGLGDAQESFDEGIEGNYSLGGKQKPGSAPSSGQFDAPMGTQTQASPFRSAENIGQSAGEQAAATNTYNPWESFLGGNPTAESPGGFAPLGSPTAKGALAPTGVSTGLEALGVAPEATTPTSVPTGVGIGDDIFGASRGSGARSHAGELGRAAAQSQFGDLAQLDLDPTRLTGPAVGGKPGGAKDLEAALGPEAWAKLLGDTLRATEGARALGSEAGVESLLQRGQTSPVGDTAFDAALISGAGQDDFAKLAREYGGGQLMKGVVDAQRDAQERWKQLQGDVAARQAMDRPRPDDQQPFDTSTPAPEGVLDAANDKSLHDLLYGEGGTDFFSLLHQAGLSFSPADWVAIAAGEAGEDVPMPTEEFSKQFDVSGGKIQQSWPQGKFQMAWGMVGKQYPKEAMAAVLKYLSDHPDVLKQYLAMKNPGFMARNLRALIENMGFQKGGQSGVQLSSETDLDDLRNELASGHWVVDPATGKRYDSLEEWDKDHRPAS